MSASRDLDELYAAIPACALPALSQAAGQVGCILADYLCWCVKTEAFIQESSQGVISDCGAEAAQVLSSTNELCEAAYAFTSLSSTRISSTTAALSSDTAGPRLATISIGTSTSTTATTPALSTTQSINSPGPETAAATWSLLPHHSHLAVFPPCAQMCILAQEECTGAKSCLCETSNRDAITKGAQPCIDYGCAQPYGFFTFSENYDTMCAPASTGLSTGARAGVGAGAAIGGLAIILIAFVFWRRRRRSRKSTPLQVLEENKADDVPEKAELAGTGGDLESRFTLSPKPELDANVEDGFLPSGASAAEMEHREPNQFIPELGSQPLHTTGVGTSDAAQEQAQAHVSEPQPAVARKPIPPPSTTNDPNTSLTGPPPSASDLYPTPQSKEAATAEETDFEYQARRLEQRRALIAERKRLAEEEEQIAMEEEALRRKKAAHAAKGS